MTVKTKRGLKDKLTKCNAIMVLVIIVNTVTSWLKAAAAITFSKQKGVATKQGWLLYEGGH